MGVSKNKKDFTGSRFGLWTVMDYRGRRNGNYLWWCKCDCGTEKEVFEPSLKSGTSKSCGCVAKAAAVEQPKRGCSVSDCDGIHFGRGFCSKHYQQEWRIKHGHIPGLSSVVDMTGMRVGFLVVLGRSSIKSGKGARWDCVCDCGKTVSVLRTNLIGGTRSCGCLRESINKFAREGKNQPNYPLWNGARKRALSASLPFDIEQKDIIIPPCCPILGIPLRKSDIPRLQDDSPTLDRIIPELGYTANNVWVISWRANRFKSDASLKELEMLAQGLRKKMEEVNALQECVRA